MEFFRRQQQQQPMFYPRTDFMGVDPWLQFDEPQRARRTFLNTEDYYDPLFGNSRGSQPTCNCMNCQTEKYYNKKQTANKEVYEGESRNRRNDDYKMWKKERNTPEQEREKGDDHVEEDLSRLKVTSGTKYTQDNLQEKQELPEQSQNIQKSADEVYQRQQKYGNENNKELEIKDSENETKYFSSEEDENEEASSYETTEEKEKSVGNKVERKIKLINDINQEVKELYKKVDGISITTVKDYDYRYCEEMLTKCLLKLDDILADGEETIKIARKNVVNEINKTLQHLEEKVE